MASIGKKAAIGEEEGHQFQLSDLPDEILIRILSLLPTVSAVRTCLLVLRKGRQQHLWKSLTSLEFHEKVMDSDFINFVDRVIDLRDKSLPLVSFSLQTEMENEDDANRIETWITKAVECNVEELTLFTPDDVLYCSLRICCIFGCQSLVKLKLESVTFNVDSSVICLPRLKYLILNSVRLCGNESTEKLLSSPLLEELIIDNCPWKFVGCIRVCSPKLQVLKFDSDYNYRYGDYDDDDEIDEEEDENSTKICIIGDNLKCFSYTGILMNGYQICASSSTQLSKVELYVNEELPEYYALNCYNILKGFSGSQNLALSDYFLKGLQNSSEFLDTIPIFECLTRLDIRVYEEAIHIDNLVLMKMYERCPLLECLNIGKISHIGRSTQLSPIPLCFRIHLKKILVHYYVPGDNEADAAIDVLLNSGLVLEEVIIYCKRDEENGIHEGGRKIQELQNRLNRRPRVSKECIISVRVTYYMDWSTASSWGKKCYYGNCYLKSMNES